MNSDGRPLHVPSEIACPVCNYDCRGLSRCPECGLELGDPSLVERHRVPWANRRVLGRIRALWRTASRVYRHPLAFADGALVEQDDREARGFVRVCLGLSLPVFAVAGYLGLQPPITEFRRQFDVSAWMGGRRPPLGLPAGMDAEWMVPLQHALYPWTATLAALIVVALLPWSLVTPFAFIRQGGRLTARAARCATLSRYFAVSLIPIAVIALVAASVPKNQMFQVLLLPAARQQVMELAALLVSLAAAPFVVYPLALFRRAGGEWWQVGAAAAIYVVQTALIVGLVYVIVIHLPGLLMTYRELWR